MDFLLKKHEELNQICSNFLKLLESDFSVEINKQLECWFNLDWKTFVSELSKKKIKMKTEQEEKWLDRFNRMSAQEREIKQVIDKTDKEIDRMVYELYGLTEDEIKIVEQQ